MWQDVCSSNGTLNLFAFRAQKSVGAKFRENRQRFEKTGRESQLKITRVKWGIAKNELLAITEQHGKSMNAVEQKHEAELKLVNERLSKLENENQELKSLLKNCLNDLE